MERRKFVIGMGALASGSAAAVGTGAFETASVNRTVTAKVEDDSSAWISLNPQSEYASTTEEGLLQIDFSEYPGNVWNAESQGMNGKAEFNFSNVFEIWADLGSSAGQYYFWIETEGFEVDVELTSGGGNSGHAIPAEGTDLTKPWQYGGQPGSVYVDMKISTSEPVDEAGGTMIIHASEDEPEINSAPDE